MKTKDLLTWLLIFFSALPAAVAGLFLIVFFNARIGELVQENIKSSANWHASDVQTFMNNNEDNLKTLVKIINPISLFRDIESQKSTIEVSAKEKAELNNKLAQNKKNIRNVILSWADTQEQVNRISIVDANNHIVLSSSNQLEGKQSFLDEKYLPVLEKGESIVTHIFQDAYANDQNSFIIASPIMDKNNYVGFLMFSMNLTYIDNLVSQAKFFESGSIIVLDSENKIIADNGRNNMTYPEFSSLNERISKYPEKTGSLRFKYLRTVKSVCYFRMPESNWTVICMVEPSEFNFPSSAVWFIIIIIGIVFATTVYLLRMVMVKIFTKPLEKLISFLHNMNKGNYGIRIPFLGKNEFSEIATAFNNLMIRIQADNRELVIKEERYRIANEQSNSIIFEFNVETGGLSCSPNACEFAAYPTFTEGFPESLIELDVVHPDDAAQFQRTTHSMTHGRRHGAMEIRMKTFHGEYHWFNMSLTTIADGETFKPLRVIGKLTDIDEEKRMTENLTFKAERDPLTSVLNKAATQTLITKRIAERKPDLYYAFIVLDIDCFKSINDGYGHQKGDEVLVELANTLISQLRGEDVVGRIGGDEFMVLLTDMPSKEAVARKMQQLIDCMRKIAIDERSNVFVTTSMGVAFCPQDGISFNQLYASADNALYVRKNAGKNGFSFFNEN